MDNWQDIVLSIGSLVFVIALLPSVLGKDKPAFSTSLMTGLVLTIFTATYATLSLKYTTVTTGVSAALWLVLAAQKARQGSGG